MIFDVDLKELKAKGHAIILSTHIFSVAEELCDEIAILVDGKIAAQGTVEEVKKNEAVVAAYLGGEL